MNRAWQFPENVSSTVPFLSAGTGARPNLGSGRVSGGLSPDALAGVSLHHDWLQFLLHDAPEFFRRQEAAAGRRSPGRRADGAHWVGLADRLRCGQDV